MNVYTFSFVKWSNVWEPMQSNNDGILKQILSFQYVRTSDLFSFSYYLDGSVAYADDKS